MRLSFEVPQIRTSETESIPVENNAEGSNEAKDRRSERQK